MFMPRSLALHAAAILRGFFVPRTIVVLVYTCFVGYISNKPPSPPGQPKDMFLEGIHKVSETTVVFNKHFKMHNTWVYTAHPEDSSWIWTHKIKLQRPLRSLLTIPSGFISRLIMLKDFSDVFFFVQSCTAAPGWFLSAAAAVCMSTQRRMAFLWPHI